MNAKSPAWLLLVTNLPGRNPTLRMRVWRALKAAGVGLLRDGVYALPAGETRRQVLEEQATEIRSAGGLTQILSFDAESPEQQASLIALFDRTAEYRETAQALASLKRELGRLSEVQARQRLAGLGREVALIVARDYFPGEAQRQLQGALADVEAAINARHSPDEPHGSRHKISRRKREDYRGRTWATRQHLWIDRVASAWLIRRFIDPKARFLWLKSPGECPKRAIGFDFDDAEFTHIDSKVTFEVLMESFGLDADPGLARLGAMVHHLDIGGIPTAEGPGFAAVMAGARALHTGDDALLAAMTPVLDSLHAAYSAADGA